jgi:hypothetical protein
MVHLRSRPGIVDVGMRATGGGYGRAVALGTALGVLACVLPGAAQASPPAQTCPASAAGLGGPMSSLAPATVSDPAPAELLACVGSRSITGATFVHWRRVAQKSGGSLTQSALLQEVMSFLISADWIINEARDLKIHLSAAEVHRSFDHTRKEQFPHAGEFRSFLRQSGQTVGDLLLRVRLNLLSARIQTKVVAGHRNREQALSRFVKSFRSKWTAKTYCSPRYAIADCGHVQSAL